MVSPFGIASKKLRIEKSLKLIDVAALLDITPAYLSAVESGRKHIQPDLVARLKKAMRLSAAEAGALQQAADRTSTAIDVEDLDPNDRELAAEVVRSIGQMPRSRQTELKAWLLRKSGRRSR